jgi:carboxypeptidase PM20D1
MKRGRTGKVVAAALGGAILVALSVALVRTLLVAAPPQITGAPPPPPVDSMTVARRLSQAIQFPTVTYGQGIRETERTNALREMYLWLQRTYPYFHEDAPQEIFGESVLYVWRGTDENLPPVLLLAHLDVAPVPVGSETQWAHQPFSGDLADGFVWGRGTLDNKSAAIAIMEAGERLAQSNFQPRRTIMFAFGEDHESGGTKGSGSIAHALSERGVRLAWVLDEGSPILTEPYPGVTRPIAMLSVAEKGLLRLELAATGEDRQARLSRAVASVLNQTFPSDIDPIQSAKLNVLTPFAPFGERLKLANLWFAKPLVIGTMERHPAARPALRTTASSVMAQPEAQDGASSPNALAVIDVHLHPRDTAASAMDRIRAAIADSDIDIRAVTEIEPARAADINGPAYAHIARAIRETFAVPVAPDLMTRATDSHHYIGVADAVLRFSPFTATPEDLARIHGADERIAVSDLGPAVGFYTWLIRNSQ